ncbi:hypothetical protein B0T26DRAFT_595731, partial [Lasiosphaeria miniovina]
EVGSVPEVGDRAPRSSDGRIAFPSAKLVLLVFLRHCGCPFAEKTFRSLTKFSTKHPEIQCIAVSQGSPAETDKWIAETGGEWNVEVIPDERRELFAQWGLGLTSTWHAMNPWVWYQTYRLGKGEGIWGSSGASLGSAVSGPPREAGTMWQMSGAFAVEANGSVAWSHVARAASDVPDFAEALKTL